MPAIMETKINVRLDESTEHQLAELVEHYNTPTLGKVTASDVVRAAIHDLHQRTLGEQ